MTRNRTDRNQNQNVTYGSDAFTSTNKGQTNNDNEGESYGSRDHFGSEGSSSQTSQNYPRNSDGYSQNYPQTSQNYEYGNDNAFRYGNSRDQNRNQMNRGDSNIQNYSGWGGTGSSYGSSSNYGSQTGSNQDSWKKGQYSGTTPKNFKRSDDRIYDDICDKLSQSGQFDISEIEIKVENGEVTLEGTLENRADKHQIEMLADGVMGVKEIHNQIKVKSSKTSGSKSTSGTASSDASEADTSSRHTSSANKPRSIGSQSNR